MKSIKQLRREAELTQGELAQKLGVHQTYVSKLEHGIVPFTDSVLQMKLSQVLEVPLTEIAPSDMPCHKHFPTVVHGKIVHKASEFYDALKESAEHCESCRKQLQDWSKALKKELAEAVWWTYLMSLDMPDRKAVLRSFQDGGDKEKRDKGWREYAELYFECLERDWDNRVPRVLRAYAEWKRAHKKDFEEVKKKGKERESSREHVQ